MAESDKASVSKVVVGGAKKHVKKYKYVIAVILVVVVAGAAYLLTSHHKKTTNQAKAKQPTVIIDGETYTVDYAPIDHTQDTRPSDAEINKQIIDAEAKAKQSPTYQNYSFVAQLYESISNKPKAIENYQKAIKLVPKDQYYQTTVDFMKQRITADGG